MKTKIIYRKANIDDISRLVEIEKSCFNYDMLDHKKFKYFITQAHAELVVQQQNDQLLGYGLILYRKGTSLCRLYSVAIAKEFQGQKLGEPLMLALEEFARKQGSSYLRLEVKVSNKKAISLYSKIGYAKFSIKHKYYEDKEDALCMEKKVQKMKKIDKNLSIPFYAQTTEFTCGPASLIMAMKSLEPKFKKNRKEEIQIWREATTIFMTSGHGGCGPHGLALSAHKRGFKPELYLNSRELLFIKGVRQKHKKEVIKIVQEDFYLRIKEKNIPVHYGKVNWNILRNIIKDGGVAIVLISSYRLTDSKTPHWIVITGINDDFIFFNDPYLEKDDDAFGNINIPIRKDEFENIAKFGSTQIQALVAIYLTP